MQKGSRCGIKRKDAQYNVIVYLAKNRPENMYKIGKQTGLYYSSVHKVINTFLLTGIVQPESNTLSQKNVKTTSYGLTFKGVLKYLSTFNIQDSINEPTTKDLLNLLERQGKILDYAFFQESRWLLELDPGIIRLFIGQAKAHLDTSIYNTSQFADNFSMHLSDPGFPFGLDDLRAIRETENSLLRDAFGKDFLQSLVCSIKTGSENEKLRRYVERILNEERAKINLLEQAVSLFSK